MNSETVGIVVFSAAIKSVLLTASCREVEKHINQFEDDRLLNIDQSKAYTRAFDSCMDDLLGTPAPNVITSIEARFWVMCGVKFTGIAAMAVGAGMRASTTECFHITGSIEKAYEFAELAANDPNLDDSRVKIRIIGTHESGYITSAQRIQAVIQSFLLPSSLELVTDGVYCLREEGLDYDRLLMPHFVLKNCGYIPNSFYTPSLCGLHVKVDALSTNKQTLDFENLDELKTLFKLRNYDPRGPFEASSGKPAIMTGAAGSGVTRLITEEKSRNLNEYPPANIIVDESTMLTQIARMKIEALAAQMGSRLFFTGDYCDKTNAPMQCPPINSASMNIENLRRVHISGVKRTSDAGLIELQEESRNIITGSAGGIYVLGGLGENFIVAAPV
ncbi:hypothetical protein T492DRAFT_844215 [Pavlovales sp. CCMP2436]|nr:hypothetical protein T492DRAFT_844215 [Pavlovales sp. CCMP2436]